MNFAEATRALDERTNYEASGRLGSPSLEKISALADLLAQPQAGYPSIHVTGTNGKGTTAALASTLLHTLGLGVGTYTSPHLHSVRERIAYGLEPITEQDFAETYAYLAPFLDEVDSKVGPVTWFETMTAMAYVYFAERAVDAAVFEVGMGGRWDATNLVDGRVAVVTKVALDHRELGDTTIEIAQEKSGIIKHGAVCVTGERDPAVLEVIRKACVSAGATMRRLDAEFEVVSRSPAIGGQALDVRIGEERYDGLFLPLFGEALATDACTGLAAVAAFFGDRRIEDDAVTEAFAAVRDPGRVEVIRRHPLVIVDGAHNADAAAALADAMRESFQWKNLHLVIGMLRDHFQQGVLDALVPMADMVYVTEPPSPRAMAANALIQGVASMRRTDPSYSNEDLSETLDQAMKSASERDAVLVTGSLYTVAAAREKLLENR